jgi:hypothetical protein
MASHRLRMSVNSQSKPKLKNCYFGVRQDLHHSIQQIALPMQSLPFLFLPKLFNYLYLYNYKAINISLFLSVCGGTFWYWGMGDWALGIGYFLLSSLSSTPSPIPSFLHNLTIPNKYLCLYNY